MTPSEETDEQLEGEPLDEEPRDGEPLDDEESLGDLLEYLAQGLVDRPDDVSVEEFVEDDGTVVLELSVADEEYGRVIGRGGRTAQALRTVVKAAAAAERRRVLVDIVD